MPTWLIGLLVTAWIARSATERPRNSHTSPVAAFATIEGGTLKFGALISTKMACAGEGLNEQETAYFNALGTAEKATVASAGTLEITSTGGNVTRFRAATP